MNIIKEIGKYALAGAAVLMLGACAGPQKVRSTLGEVRLDCYVGKDEVRCHTDPKNKFSPLAVYCTGNECLVEIEMVQKYGNPDTVTKQRK